jgi:hypothetical protein
MYIVQGAVGRYVRVYTLLGSSGRSRVPVHVPFVCCECGVSRHMYVRMLYEVNVGGGSWTATLCGFGEHLTCTAAVSPGLAIFSDHGMGLPDRGA